MNRDCLHLSPFSTLDDALLIFQSRKIGAMPVIDEEERVIGIFSMGDLMKAYRCLFGLGEKGSVLISIEDDNAPQVLSKLVKLLEEKQVEFTRLVRSDGSCKSKPMIYLRIKTYNVRSVYKTLEAAGFTIHVPETTV
jgi:acetoin utilization protein AcuB